MAEVGSAVVALIPSFKGGQAAIEKELGGAADGAGKKAGGRFGKVFASATMSPLKAVGAAALGLFAIDKVKDFFTSAVGEAREGQKVAAVTAQVIKATGGAAKLSAQQVGDLSTELSNKTGIDDEVIQSGANLLLTFKNVKNEVGSGNDVFKRATAAAADLSAAGFGSVTGASLQLGKALNDPVKGIAALSRSGVTFTEQQKQQIKTLTASGKTLEAQKIILAEVEAQVGGTAAASATAGEKFAVSFGNFKEEIGTKLLPIIDQVLGGASKLLPVILQLGSQVGAFLGPAFAKAGELIKGLVGSMGDGTQFATVGNVIKDVFGTIGTIISGVASVALPIITQVAGALRQAFVDNAPAIKSAMGSIREVVVNVLQIVQIAWAKLGPVILPIIKNVFGTLVGVISGALKVISGIVKLVLSLLKGDFKGAGDALKKIWSGLWQIVTSILKGAVGILKAMFGGLWNSARGAFSSGVAAVVGFVRALPGKAASAIASLGSALLGKIRGAWSSAVSGTSAGAGKVVSFIRGLPGKMVSALGNLGGLLRNAGRNLIDGLLRGIQNAFGAVKRKLAELTNLLPDWKGPPSKDRRILKPAGEMIMAGLNDGITSGARGVEQNLRGITTSIGGIQAGYMTGTEGRGGLHVGTVVINPETIAQLQSAVEFFEVIEQEARRTAPNMQVGRAA